MTENDLLEALREALQAPTERPEGAHRVEELCDATGHCEKFIRDKIKVMLKDGSAEMVEIPFLRMDGRRTRVPAYRFKAA